MRIQAAAVSLFLLGISASWALEASDGSERYPKRREGQAAAGAGTVRATFTVNPGQLIQSAVERCQPGDRIEVMPGTYTETISIDLDSIELAGIIVNGERPLLDGKGEMNDAVLVSGHNFAISGFEIRNYKGNGVVVNKAENCSFRDIVAADTGKYALYPVECKGVLVERCVASGVWDAAIYAGQCRDVVIRDCEVYNNTIGIETENCVNVLVSNNSAHDNSLGFLVVLLPNLPSKSASNARLIGNRSISNNYPNLSPPGNIVNQVVPGVGIAINAADNTEVTKNLVTGHINYGIGLYGLSDIFPDPSKLDVEPNPDNNYIHGNTLAKNGEDPTKIAERFAKYGAKGGDLFWSGKGTGNVWSEATKRTFPETLPTGGPVGVAGGAQ